MAQLAARLQAVFSTLFRLLVYVYLRVIPGPQGRYLVPGLFVAYIIPWTIDLITPAEVDAPVAVLVEEEEKVEIKPTNEDGSKVDVTTTDTIAVTAVEVVQPTSLFSILFSLPTSSSWDKIYSLVINAILLGLVADFLIRPTFYRHDDLVFTRVGAVYNDAAKIVVRYPNVEGGVRIVWKQAGGVGGLIAATTSAESGWLDGPLLELTPEQDWVGTAKLENLWTSTKYEYRLAAANSSLLPYPANPLTFKTFPDPRIHGHRFKFIASSCIMPNFPYKPFRPTTTITGFELLSKELSVKPEAPAPHVDDLHLENDEPLIPQPTFDPVPNDPVIPRQADSPAEPTPEAPLASVTDHVEPALTSPLSVAVPPLPEVKPAEPVAPAETEFLLLLGDFIYADGPAPIADEKEAFLQKYRRTYASEEFRKVYEHLPILNMYDDHEIRNDYNGYSNETAPFWNNASTSWSIYQGEANYDSHPVTASGHKPNYYDFTYGDVAFFVLDTRRYRAVVGLNKTGDGQVPTILGDRQMTDFTTWVGKVNSTAAFKFIISSVPVTGMWGPPNGQIDTWIGAPSERKAFLDLLAYVPNVVVISGDRHEFAAVEHLGYSKHANSIHEFSISPLSQFYIPFIPTFWPSNAPIRESWGVTNVTHLDGTVEEVETLKGYTVTEKMIKYIPHGNYKWGTFEVDTTDSEAPVVKFDLTVDGKKAWEYKIIGKPVRWTGSTSLSAAALAESVTEGVRNVISKLGRIFG